MCVCVCIYIYIYMHKYIYVYVYISKGLVMTAPGWTGTVERQRHDGVGCLALRRPHQNLGVITLAGDVLRGSHVHTDSGFISDS